MILIDSKIYKKTDQTVGRLLTRDKIEKTFFSIHQDESLSCGRAIDGHYENHQSIEVYCLKLFPGSDSIPTGIGMV